MAFDASKYAAGDSPWLKAQDLEDQELDSCVVSIEDYNEHTFPGRDGKPDETKLTVKFKEFEKWLSLNKTNAQALCQIHGTDADMWSGQRVKLFVTMVNNPQGGPKVKSLAIGSAPLKRKAAEPELVGAGKAGKGNPFEDE